MFQAELSSEFPKWSAKIVKLIEMGFQRIRAPYSPRACAINIGPTSYLQQRDERGIRGYAGQQEREPFIGIGNAPSGVNLSNCHGDTAGANHITAERYPP